MPWMANTCVTSFDCTLFLMPSKLPLICLDGRRKGKVALVLSISFKACSNWWVAKFSPNRLTQPLLGFRRVGQCPVHIFIYWVCFYFLRHFPFPCPLSHLPPLDYTGQNLLGLQHWTSAFAWYALGQWIDRARFSIFSFTDAGREVIPGRFSD